MSKFKILRQFDLEVIGKEWKGCYLEFNALAYGEIFDLVDLQQFDMSNPVEAKKSKDATLNLLQSKFVKGTAINTKGETVPFVKEDFVELPVNIVNNIVIWMFGEPDPKS